MDSLLHPPRRRPPPARSPPTARAISPSRPALCAPPPTSRSLPRHLFPLPLPRLHLNPAGAISSLYPPSPALKPAAVISSLYPSGASTEACRRHLFSLPIPRQQPNTESCRQPAPLPSPPPAPGLNRAAARLFLASPSPAPPPLVGFHLLTLSCDPSFTNLEMNGLTKDFSPGDLCSGRRRCCKPSWSSLIPHLSSGRLQAELEFPHSPSVLQMQAFLELILPLLVDGGQWHLLAQGNSSTTSVFFSYDFSRCFI